MTIGPRVDRLERIAKLFVKAGLRARTHMRELDEKFDMLVNMQMANAQKFARNEERFVRVEKKLAKLSEKTDQRIIEMWEAHTVTDRKLTELIQILKQRQNGNGNAIDN
jgi:hypothetical protein